MGIAADPPVKKTAPSPALVNSRVSDNFNLARFWARKMERFHGYNDALSLAMEGLLQAAENYEEGRTVRFGTYASYQIKSKFAGEFRRRMTKRRGGELSHCSMDAPVGEGFSVLGDSLPDEATVDPVRVLELLERSEKVDELLALLTPHKRKIVEMRYGLKGKKPMFLEEIAVVYGVSRERIRQIEAESLRRFWRYLNRKSEESAALTVC